jgi:hypothetical protein
MSLRTLIATLLFAFVGLGCRSMRPTTSATASTSQPDVVIDHNGGGNPDPAGTILKRPGENVHIQVRNTNTSCFSFNTTVAPTQPAVPANAATVPMDQTIDFNVRYDGTPTTITIAAYPNPGAVGCPTLASRAPGGDPGPWLIHVATDGWDLAFSGAFTTDKLTDPNYTLVPGTKPSPTAGGTPTSGFIVTKNEGDQYRLGSAAMVHLYHTDPDPLGRAGITWAPISFGLGVGDASHVRYYVGSGVRFDKKLFLTAGAVFGSRKSLPAGLTNGAFTTDQNALSTMGSHTARAMFFSISYSFVGVGPDAFKASFTAPSSTAPAAASGQTANTNASSAATITFEGTPASSGATYQLSITNKGSDITDAILTHAFPNTVPGVWTVSPSASAECGAAATSDQTSLSAKITKLPKEAKCTYIVTLHPPQSTPLPNALQLKTTLTGSDKKTLKDEDVTVKLK